MKSRAPIFLGCAAIGLAGWAAYHNSLAGPFVLDDSLAIAENSTLRHLWPLSGALHPPAGGLPVSGRPLVNLSFALNYAAGGLTVGGYHGVNLAIHLAAGLTLFGFARRLFGRLACAAGAAVSAGFAVSLLWTVHPLQTAAVTYLSQRAEALMGLWYLLTLYGFLRAVEADEAGAGRAAVSWRWISWLACLLGMASKETMVSAPLLVLVLDRSFCAGSFRGAWKSRRGYYLGLAATWVLLAGLVAAAGNRGGTAGFGGSVPWPAYAEAQARGIQHYLRLAVWPSPLVFRYGTEVLAAGRAGGWKAALVLAGMAGTLGALVLPEPAGWQTRALGFAGLWFFAILAPSSSVIPISTEIWAEHRMYLPLAAVIAVLVLGFLRGWRSLPTRWSGLAGPRALVIFAVPAAAALAFATARRNEDYRSALALWSDTAEKDPNNPLARIDLGDALARAGRLPEAAAQFEAAARLQPEMAEIHYDLGIALARAGRRAEGISQLEWAVRLKPSYAEARVNLGNAYASAGRSSEAMGQFSEALRWRPDLAEAHFDLANLLAGTGRNDEAIGQYEAALRLEPDSAAAQANLGNALARAGRLDEAIDRYRGALRADPRNSGLRRNLGLVLRALGREAEAEEQFAEALRPQPP